MNSKILKSFSFMALILVALLTLSGCNKVTEKNYKKIDVDMTKAKVIKLLGEQDDSTMTGSYTIYYWFDKADSYQEAVQKVASGKTVKYIEVSFADNKVVTSHYGNFKIETDK